MKPSARNDKPKNQRRNRFVRPALRGVAANSLDELKAQTRAQCLEEFEKRWGQPYNPRKGLGRSFLSWWEADVGNKSVEDEARRLYENTRKSLDRLADKVERFREEAALPDGAGGIAAIWLRHFEEQVRKTPPLADLEAKYYERRPELRRYSRRDGRAALVARFSNPVPWLGGVALTNRELAVVSLLLGVGPGGWAAYASGGFTAPKVIEDEETRIRRCRSAEASGSG